MGFIACTARTTALQTSKTTQNLTLNPKLQNILDQTLKASGIKGASAAIILPDNEIWIGVSGMSDPTVGKQIIPEMLFDIGSIGKSYLAALVLQLAEEGRFTLDDPISGWVPRHPHIDTNITIRQLLNHTSGIYDFVKHPKSPWQLAYKSTQIWTQDKILTELVNKPYFSPGNGWHYSTTNYTLLRMIAEKATGTQVSTEIRNRFLTPLSLDSSIILEPLERLPEDINIANNWIGEFVDLAPKPQPWSTTSPDLIYATAEDAAKWMHLLYHEKLILNQRSLDQMLNFHSPTPNDPQLSGYGLGVMFIDHALAENEFGVKGIRMWGHGGSTHGFRSIAMYLPDHGTTISVLVNGNNDEGFINIFIGFLKVITDEHMKQS